MVVVGAAVAAVVIVVGIVVALASGDGREPPGASRAEPGVAHVHGLGVNTADGSLIVATHFGSFRLPTGGGSAERIGDSYQDTMGFTVAGADHFLGSGHPDVQAMRAGQPTRLGLIESVDAGASWSILSLGGEADFHALAFAHDQVYGWDAGTGRFMVSADRRAWQTRSTVELFGFAVDPKDEDGLVATGPDGLLESTDGGRSWRAAENGPALVALSWDVDAGLWGVDAGGAVWTRSGPRWDEVGALPGQPQAFLATAQMLYAAAHDADGRTAIYQSSDRGRTWDLRYRDPDQ